MTTHAEQLALPPSQRGWTDEEAFDLLDHDTTSLDGPNCPWHGRPHVVTTKSYSSTGRNSRVTAIGWRCRKCGNRWGWRKWWKQVGE